MAKIAIFELNKPIYLG